MPEGDLRRARLCLTDTGTVFGEIIPHDGNFRMIERLSAKVRFKISGSLGGKAALFFFFFFFFFLYLVGKTI